MLMFSSSTSRALVIQVDDKPAIVCGEPDGVRTKNIHCRNCSHILVEGFEDKAAAGIYIECFRCKTENYTGPWPYGQPYPYIFRNLTRLTGVVEAKTPLQIPANVSVLSNEEFQRVRLALKPGPRTGRQINLTPEGLLGLVEELNGYIKGKGKKPWFAKRLQEAESSLQENRSLANLHPLAWAIVTLRKTMTDGSKKVVWQMHGYEGMAVLFILQYRDVVERWKDKPNFNVVLDSLDNEFTHTATMMAALGYMTENPDLPVAIMPKGSANNGKTAAAPDLFMNIGRADTFSMEVKAPSTLLFPDMAKITQDKVNVIVKNWVDSASENQLTGEYGGCVVVGASHADPSFRAMFEQSLTYASHNAPSDKVAAVIGVFNTPIGEYKRSGNVIDVTTYASVIPVPNPNFRGSVLFETK